MEIALVLIAVFLVIVYAIVVSVGNLNSSQSDKYNSPNHIGEGSKRLHPDACVASVDVKIVGSKNHRRFRTTVVFDDGFRYVSHDGNHREDRTFSYTVTLYDGEKTRIISDAIKAHNQALLSMGIEVCEDSFDGSVP